MAPATPGAGTDSSTSLIQANNLTSNFPSTAPSLSSSFCHRRSNDSNSDQVSGGDVPSHRFAVPGTTTVLYVFYCPEIPLQRDWIHDTIFTAHTHMQERFNIFGDKPLQAADDPYSTPVVPHMNCGMTISSHRVPRTGMIPNHLTYAITLNALEGLFGFLYTEGHFVSAITEVIDPGLTGTMVRVGLISIRPLE